MPGWVRRPFPEGHQQDSRGAMKSEAGAAVEDASIGGTDGTEKSDDCRFAGQEGGRSEDHHDNGV
ncbi:hypothetical protein TRIP_B40383 [uncultured Desulfatiglans sp.]|nr:hypothetical protein TRIP_B40383 [uncultured Desulfatiglans sp.]